MNTTTNKYNPTTNSPSENQSRSFSSKMSPQMSLIMVDLEDNTPMASDRVGVFSRGEGVVGLGGGGGAPIAESSILSTRINAL